MIIMIQITEDQLNISFSFFRICRYFNRIVYEIFTIQGTKTRTQKKKCFFLKMIRNSMQTWPVLSELPQLDLQVQLMLANFDWPLLLPPPRNDSCHCNRYSLFNDSRFCIDLPRHVRQQIIMMFFAMMNMNEMRCLFFCESMCFSCQYEKACLLECLFNII